MSDLTGVTTNYLPTAHETFQDTTSASITSGDTTVFINNLGEYTVGDVVVLTVEPGTANEATFTGVVASGPARVTNVKWTEGNTAANHNSGSTVIDYDSATHYNMLSKALKQIMNQNGTLITSAVQAALGLGADTLNGWNALGYAPNSVVDNGSGNYTLTINSVDLTGITAVGQKLLLPRAATATQCATFDGVNDYFSKATPNKMAWTDDFTASVWIKPSAYQQGTIFSRYNGTSGYYLELAADGRIAMYGLNGGAGNYSGVLSNQGIILNRWQHISALLDMSAFTSARATAETAKSWIMVDGFEVDSSVTRAGTLPTTLVQAGNWEVGARNSGTVFYAGKMAQVAVYNTRVLQATIRASRNQPLTGSETGLATAHSFNNSIIDLNTTTPNDLTANGGVVATTAETPFTSPVTGTNLTAGTKNYGVIVAQSFSTNTTYTVQVPNGETIPTTTPPTSLSYSGQKSPYGFPGFPSIIGYVHLTSTATTTSGSLVDIPGLYLQCYVPAGKTVRAITGGAGTTSVANNGGIMGITDVTAGLALANGAGTNGASGDVFSMYASRVDTPSSGGMRTYKATFARGANAATLTLQASTTNPAFLSIELVEAQ